MVTATGRQLRTWVTACRIAAGLLAFPSLGTSQPATCDADLLPALPVPELRISAAKAELRMAPESDGKVAVTLPQDITVPLLGQYDGWFVVNYRDRNRYRRLYVSSLAAEVPSAKDYGPRHFAAQRWSNAHSRICGKISRARTATRAFAGGALLAGVSAIIWRAYVKDDDGFSFDDGNGHAWEFETDNRYGTVLAVWTAMGVGAFLGAVYQGIRLRQAGEELSDLGWPRLNTGGVLLPGFGGARGDLLFDTATGRQAVVLTWQPWRSVEGTTLDNED